MFYGTWLLYCMSKCSNSHKTLNSCFKTNYCVSKMTNAKKMISCVCVSLCGPYGSHTKSSFEQSYHPLTPICFKIRSKTALKTTCCACETDSASDQILTCQSSVLKCYLMLCSDIRFELLRQLDSCGNLHNSSAVPLENILCLEERTCNFTCVWNNGHEK